MSQKFLLVIHIGCLTTGIALLFLGFLVAILLLLQTYRIKHKRVGGWVERLPPLQRLDRWLLRSISFGFPFITLGIVLGLVLAHHRWTQFWNRDPMVLLMFLCWCWYALLLFFRMVFGWRGTRLALLNIVGFAVVVFTLFGLRLLFDHSLHPLF